MNVFRLGWTSFISIAVGLLCGGFLFAAVLFFNNTESFPVSVSDMSATAPTSISNFDPIEPAPASNSSATALAPLPVAATSSGIEASVSALLKANSALASSLSETSSSSSLIFNTSELVDQPLFLTISKLKLHVGIQAVGFATSGAVGIPTNYTDVGWFKFGPRPGQVGNATMNGHVVTRSFGAGVFSGLHTLVPGDEVEVNTAQAHMVFKVIKAVSYNVDEAPVEEIFGPTDKRMLNLITCEGTWIQERKMYDKRLVVFTELVQSVEE